MTKKQKTPMEKSQSFAHKFVASMRLHETLREFDKLTPEERSTPENRLVWELLIKAIEMSYEAHPIEA